MPIGEEYLASIHSLAKQYEYTYQAVKKLPVDVSAEITDVIVAGMGGSAFGGRAVLSMFSDDKLMVPLRVVSDYRLPAYADEKTLVIVTSYSGNTEETISVFHEAKERGCQVFCITSGGKEAELIQSGQAEGYVFNAQQFPSPAPRTGIGYVVGATVALLARLKLLLYTDNDAQTVITFLHDFLTSDQAAQEALKVSQRLHSKIPVFITAEHADGAGHIWRNFMNETAKHTGFHMPIPNLNHHFLDGLGHPNIAKEALEFVYVESPLYHERTRTRFEITEQVTRKLGYDDVFVQLPGTSRELDFWHAVAVGCLSSYNLARFHGANPATNEMVDFLKTSLGLFELGPR